MVQEEGLEYQSVESRVATSGVAKERSTEIARMLRDKPPPLMLQDMSKRAGKKF